MTIPYGYGIQLLSGAGVTLAVALLALALGTIVGILLGAVKTYGAWPFRFAVETYTSVVRGVPDLIVIYLIYFGSTVALTKITGSYVNVDGFTAGVFSLVFIFSAYASDVFRGAILQVPRGQIEAAKALALPAGVMFLKVVLPQAWRLAIPGFGNLSIVLLKQTSLISVIGLEELLRASAVVSGATREPLIVYSITALIYFLMTSAASFGLRRLRLHFNRGYV